MIILALDTTTAAGSIALARDDEVIDVHLGDRTLNYARRLPGDIVALLERQRLAVTEIDLYVVAAGPGSFTGLRVGIATIQGLAFANKRSVAAVSALDALAQLGGKQMMGPPIDFAGARQSAVENLVGVWMDAHRGEVFSALYGMSGRRRQDAPGDLDGLASEGGPEHHVERTAELPLLDMPRVAAPADVVRRWAGHLEGRVISFIGDGAIRYRGMIGEEIGPTAQVIDPIPPLAPVLASLGLARALAGGALGPDAIRPLYVRRPDAEVARDRARDGLEHRTRRS